MGPVDIPIKPYGTQGKSERMTLLHITAPHFCAGAVVENGKVTRAAPILGYMRGWDPAKVKAYAARKGWKVLETPIND